VHNAFHPRALTLTPAVARLFSSSGWDVLAAVPDPDVDVEREAVAALDAEEVRRYVDRLPPKERVVIQLRYGLTGYALTCREVAAFCSVAVGSANAAERRGLEQLRAMYRRDGLLPQ
jgi:DNA-directed RNA polymerase specialized sigma24 family protein